MAPMTVVQIGEFEMVAQPTQPAASKVDASPPPKIPLPPLGRFGRWFGKGLREIGIAIRATWGWILAHPGAFIALFTLLIVGPFLVGLIIYYAPRTGWYRTVLEGLVTAWPSQDHLSKFWLGTGVAMSAFTVFGAPIALAIFIDAMIRRAERKFKMTLDSYLERRDKFFRGWITTELMEQFRVLGLMQEHVERTGLSQEEVREIAKTAVANASENWSDLVEGKIGDLSQVKLDIQAD